MINTLMYFLKGIVVGVANIIPGVSGGTIAVILGIFDKLINAVNTVFKEFKKNIKFLIPLGFGMVVGIIAFSKLLEPSLNNFPFPTNMFFVGLVAGSIPLIWKKANREKFKPVYLIPMLVSATVVVFFAFIQKSIDEENIRIFIASEANEKFFNTPQGLDYIRIAVFGAIASACMVIPGISGSFIMILLGIYGEVLGAVSGLTNSDTIINSILFLTPFALGVIFGVVLIAKLIEFLLKKFYSYTYFAILGLVLASIYSILYSPNTYFITETKKYTEIGFVLILISAVTLTAGFFLAFFLGKEKEEKKN